VDLFFHRDDFDADLLSHKSTGSANAKSVTMLTKCGSDSVALWETPLPLDVTSRI